MSGFPGAKQSAVLTAARETLTERLAGWRERYPDVNVHPRVVLDHPARHLLDEARTAQLVVVGSHGRGGFGGMLLGSVSPPTSTARRPPGGIRRA